MITSDEKSILKHAAYVLSRISEDVNESIDIQLQAEETAYEIEIMLNKLKK